MNILWIDTETTGLSAYKCDMIQFAGLIEVDGEIKDKVVFNAKPTKPENVEKKALDVNGYAFDQVMAFPDISAGIGTLVGELDKYEGKFVLAGQNVTFDISFLKSAMFKAYKKFAKYFDYHSIDLLSLTALLRYCDVIDVEDLKLATICEHLEVNLGNAHDALADIEATREAFMKLKKYIVGVNDGCTEESK